MTENEMLQEICDVLNDNAEHKIGKKIIRVFKNYMDKVLDKKDVELNTRTLSVFISAIVSNSTKYYYKNPYIDSDSIRVKFVNEPSFKGYRMYYKDKNSFFSTVRPCNILNFNCIELHKENHSCLKTLSKILLPPYIIEGFDENHKCYRTDEIIKEERKQFNR